MTDQAHEQHPGVGLGDAPQIVEPDAGQDHTKDKQAAVRQAEACQLHAAQDGGEHVLAAQEYAAVSPEMHAELDEDEQEFRKLRVDLPGVKGYSASGIVAISVGKSPGKNEFFRTRREPDFRPIMPVVDHEVGIEKQFFALHHEARR